MPLPGGLKRVTHHLPHLSGPTKKPHLGNKEDVGTPGLPTSPQAWLRRENTKGDRWLTPYEGNREMGQEWEADSLGLHGEQEGALAPRGQIHESQRPKTFRRKSQSCSDLLCGPPMA